VACHLQIDAGPDPVSDKAYHFEADPGYQNDADPDADLDADPDADPQQCLQDCLTMFQSAN
jgi:hypothetical protein